MGGESTTINNNPTSTSTSTSTPTQTFNVLVTGFGPYPTRDGGHYDKNASKLIALGLPSHLNLSTKHATTSEDSNGDAQEQHSTKKDININIINPHATSAQPYVKTEYAYVRSWISELHALPHVLPAAASPPPPQPISPDTSYHASTLPTQRIDLILHLGQAGYCNEPPSLAIERLSFSQSTKCTWWSLREEQDGFYRIPDDIGATIDDVEGGRDVWREKGVLDCLSSSINVDEVHARAQGTPSSKAVTSAQSGLSQAKELDIILHHEPGPYLCGFIYHESLAQCYVRRKKRDVLFCHVPALTEEEDVRAGVRAVERVVRAAVGTLVARREREEEKEKQKEKEKEKTKLDRQRKSEAEADGETTGDDGGLDGVV